MLNWLITRSRSWRGSIARFVAATLSIFVLLVSAALPAQAQPQPDAGLYGSARPGVVRLTSYDAGGLPLQKGTGFAVDDEGVIVTSGHVVEDAAFVEIVTAAGETRYATALLGSDPGWDLALVQGPAGAAPPLPLAETASPQVGAPVHVLGTAVNLEAALFSGVVSASRPHGEDGQLLEISNQVFRITTGAPLLSNDGEVVGVVVFGGMVPGRNFAVPVSEVRHLLSRPGAMEVVQPLGELSSEARQRIQKAESLRNEMLAQCSANDIVNTDRVVREAIAVGAPVYNDGNHLACFKVYEGAGYKLLFLLERRCPAASAVLREAVVRAEREASASRKAWLMRFAFDTILGVPTQTGDEPPPEL